MFRLALHGKAACLLLAMAFFFAKDACAQTLNISEGVHNYASLTNTTVTMTGKSELRVTDAANPITGSTIHLNSPDAWFWLSSIRPQTVADTYLSQIRVNGAVAVHGSNVRVVQYALGTVVIPHGPSFQPLQAYSGPGFTGDTQSFGFYTYYNTAGALGAMHRNLSSFKLKRGYMATFAAQADGTGSSKVYVAQDSDIEVSLLPSNLDNAAQFVRVFPWRWVSKKGSCDVAANTLNATWFYNWNNDQESTLNWEYVPIKQQPYWPGTPTNKQNVTHFLGFNEPDNPVEDAYQNLGNGSVDAAIGFWPEMLKSGLRVGSPAVTDGGRAWLYEFMDKARANNLRVDYIAIHNYQCGKTNASFQAWLKEIYDRYHLPIWITEFNNGANWTNCGDPTLAQNATAIAGFIDMMDNTPWIERYAVYSNVEDVRKMVDSSGNLTPAGIAYRDNASPIGYVQEPLVSEPSRRSFAQLPLDGHTRDTSGYGNDGLAIGTPAYTTGKRNQAIQLDGSNGFIQLPSNVGNSAAFTFAGWMYWDGGNNWQRVFDFGTGTSSYMFLTPRSGSGTLRFAIKNGGAEQIVETTAPAAAQWVHVAVTLSGGAARLYVNGTLAATNSAVTLKPSDFAPNLNYIGKSQFGADPLFKGRLDEILITDYALTAAQISALQTNTPPQFSAAVLTRGPAALGTAFSGTIAGAATDADAGDTITYSKVSGPSWLAVASNGALSGTPTFSFPDPQEFTVRATDSRGANAFAVLRIGIQAHYWRGDVDNTWSANSSGNTNWSSDAAGTTDAGSLPGSASNILFAASNAANLPGTILGVNFSVRGLTVTSASGVTVGGTHNLTLGADGFTLMAGSGATSLNTTGTVTLGANQVWNHQSASTLSVTSNILGTAALTLNGDGSTLFTGANTYSGGTTLNAGSLQIGNGGTSGSLAGSLANNGAVTFDRSDASSFAGIISGTGSVTKAGAGVLTLSATNTYSGGTTIGIGQGAGVLRTTATNALGTGAVNIGGAGNASMARLELSNGITLPNALAIAQRNNSSVAVQNLSGNNTLSGAISLGAGGSTAIFQSDAGVLTLSNTLESATGNRTATFTGVGAGVASGVIQNGAGNVSVMKSGAATWTLSGNNTYTGTTTVNAGTLKLGAGERIANASNLTLNGGTFATGGFNETMGTLALGGNATLDFGTGASTLRFSGPGTFAAGVVLNIINHTGGSDQLFIGTSQVLTAAQLAQISFNGTPAAQLSNGRVVPSGLRELYWTGDQGNNWSTNNAGNTNWATDVAGTVDAGQIPDAGSAVVFASGVNLGSTVLGSNLSVRSVTVTATTAVGIGGTHTLTLGADGISVAQGAGAVTINTGGQISLNGNQTWASESGNALTVSSPVTGAAMLAKAGSGTLVLSGANTYSGGSAIQSGTLQIGNGGTTGSIVGNLANEGTLIFNRSNNLSFGGVISGTGSLAKWGAGTLTLGAVNTYSGGTTIGGANAGSRFGNIRATANNALGTGPVTIGPSGNDSTARLELSGGISLVNDFTFPQRNNATASIESLDGNNTLSGNLALTLGGGNAIVQSNAGLLTLSGTVQSLSGARTLVLTGAGAGAFTGSIGNGTGTNTVAVTKSGTGTWTLSGSNSYSGATTINAGTLALGASNVLPNSSNVSLNGGTLAANGFTDAAGTLSLAANSTLNFGSGTSTLTFSGPGTFSTGTTLTITNWTQGSDHLYIGNGAVLTTSQLAQIKFGTQSARQLSTGEVVPVSATPVRVAVIPNSGLTTSEGGGNAAFTVRLEAEPGATVQINLLSSDTTEGAVSPAALTFSADNWNTPQTVTVQGVNDDLIDGSVAYTVTLEPATSTDSQYLILDTTSVTVTNADNDAIGPEMRFTTAVTTPVGTTPVNGATVYNNLPNLTGTAASGAADNKTLDVVKVELKLSRVNGGTTEFWNGTNWAVPVGGASAPSLTTSLSPSKGAASVTWSRIGGWPTGTNLPDGTYSFHVVAVNRSGARGNQVDTSFNKATDMTAPTVLFTNATTNPLGTSPIHASTVYNSMPAITGVATDAGSGVNKVQLRLHRVVNSVVEYWDGSSWSTTATLLSTTSTPSSGGQEVSWSKNAGWPMGTNLPEGTYYLRALANDKAGRLSLSDVLSFQLATDMVSPTVSFTTAATTPAGTTPVQGSTVYSIPTLTGVAADQGSGVAKVTLRLQRVVNSVAEYWNGIQWTTAMVDLPANLNPAAGGANVTWAKSGAWPSGADLPAGTYYVRALAYDRAGRAVSVLTNFKIGSSPAALSVRVARNFELPSRKKLH